MEPTFIAGDRVICVDDADLSFDVINLGAAYIVKSVNAAGFVIIEGVEGFFLSSRFVLSSNQKRPEMTGEVQVVSNDQVYMYDVDDTLVMWNGNFGEPGIDRVMIVDPYDGVPCYLKPHHRHIKLLKQMHGRKRFIVVWSAGGALWAKAVIDALGISEFVHLVMTKPQGYVDDLPIQESVGKRIYLNPDGGQNTDGSKPTYTDETDIADLESEEPA